MELKPCPFCGNVPITNVHYWKCGGDELGLVAEVKCENCGGVSQSVVFDGEYTNFDKYINSFNIAIERWNTRIDE